MVWSSTGVDSCRLTCDEGPSYQEVPTNGIRLLEPDGAIGCELNCEGGLATACSASLEVAGSCPPPSCTATTEGSPEIGYSLRVDTEADSCTYSCSGDGGVSGTMECQDAVPLGNEPLSCRVWAESECHSMSRCSTKAWSMSIEVDGSLRDWMPGTAFPTDEGRNYLSWDDEKVYVAVQHPALAVDSEHLSVMVYLGNGTHGLETSAKIGSQVSQLPAPISHALRWTLKDSVELLVPNAKGGWVVQRGRSDTVWEASDAGAGVVELAVAREILALDQDLIVHINIVDATPGAEHSFAPTPYASHAGKEMGVGSYFAEAVRADLSDYVQPNSSPTLTFTAFENLPSVLWPAPAGTGHSLRIATFNGGYVDVPHWEPDLDAHVIGLCGAVASIGQFLSLAIIPAGVFIPPDPLSLFAMCNLVIRTVIDDNNESLEAGIGGPLSHDERAEKVGARILQMDLDVVALNEIFVESARQKLLNILKPTYPHIVARIEHPADTDLGDIAEEHFGAYFVQDSGLMLFSKHPFLPLSGTAHLVPDAEIDLYVNGVPTTNSGQTAVAFTEYRFDCQRSDCNSGKGAALVRIEKTPQQRFAVAWSHLQASYGDDEPGQRSSGMDLRVAQFGKIRQLVNDSLTATERGSQEVFVLGDLNVIGRYPDGQDLNTTDWPGLELPGGESQTSLTNPQNRDWDLGRQEWLHHFCGLRSGVPGEPCLNENPQQSHLDDPVSPGFFACGDGTANDCPDGSGNQFLVDSWAYDGSPHDLGPSEGRGALAPSDNATCSHEAVIKSKLCAGQRLDYILHNQPSQSGTPDAPIDRNSVCAQHMTIAYELSGAGGTQPLSDHLPVRGDFNRAWPFCRARDAKEVGDPELGANNTFSVPGRIQFPGSMQWYRITEPGSYSIGVNPESTFAFQVYDHEDLSRPRPSYHKMESRWGTRYQLPNPPYYVRVFASTDDGHTADRATTGSYSITIHRHDCTSAEDACMLMAGGVTQALWPDEHFAQWNVNDPHHDSGPDAQWFIFTTYNDDTGKTPDLSFEYETRCLDHYELEVVEYCPAHGLCPNNLHSIVVGSDQLNAAVEPCELCEFAFDELRGETNIPAPPKPNGKQFFLRALRDEPQGPGCTVCIPDPNGKCSAPELERTVEVRYGTNLTIFYPDTLQLQLSEDDWGDDTDELWFFLDVNVPGPTMQCDSCGGAAGNYSYLGQVTEGGPSMGVQKMKIHAYVTNLQPNLYSEAEPGSYDTDEAWFVPRGGTNACEVTEPTVAKGFKGLCPLDEDESNTPKASDNFWYSDHAGGDPEEADYLARLRYCLAHEWTEPSQAGQTKTEACRKWVSEAWGN